MRFLYVIPARGGSKGIPGKNIKPLGNKPLIHYSLEFARQFVTDSDICVSTDSDQIAECVKSVNYQPRFIRPSHLATDTIGTFEVLEHALSFYQKEGKVYDGVILLQPTSPIREKFQLDEAMQLFSKDIDMVVSVNISGANPYFNLFEEDGNGYLHISKGDGKYSRRQDAPEVYSYNGSLYIINASSLMEKKSFSEFRKIVKYIMPEKYSIDLDTMADWQYAEFIVSERISN
ncbi:MAG TPA: acylneuraminate cytidylyltransferase family protein [Chitinophagaceae bacterium]